MATYKTTGGGNLTELFALDSSWALNLSKTWSLDKKFSTQITGHEKSKNIEAALTHESFDSTIIGAATALFDQYLSEIADEGEEKYEDGVDSKAETNPENILLAITYSGKSNETTPKRLVRCFLAELQGGGYTMEADGTIRVETTLKGVPNKSTSDISILATMFSTALVTGASAQTIAVGSYGTSFWLTAV